MKTFSIWAAGSVLVAALAVTSAHAYDPTQATKYPSPDMNTPNVNRLVIQGPGSTGDISGMTIKPTVAPFARALASVALDVTNVRYWGAICDGAVHPLSERYGSLAAAQAVYPFVTSLTQSIDGAAIEAAKIYAQARTRKDLYFPLGHCRTDRTHVITGPNWTIRGDGMMASTIETSLDADIFQSDISNGNANLGSLTDLQFLGPSGGTASTAFHMTKTGVSTTFGASQWRFANLMFRRLKHGLWFTQPGTFLFADKPISNYSYFDFNNLRTATLEVGLNDVVKFDGGPGNHHTWNGGFYQSVEAGIIIGNGEVGLGDLSITGVHFVNSRYAMKLIGPTDLDAYRENVLIEGNQFDGLSQGTIYAERMRLRIGRNNATTAVSMVLIDCDNTHALVEDQFASGGSYAFQRRPTLAGTNSLGVFDLIRAPSVLPTGDAFVSARVTVDLSVLIGDVGVAHVAFEGHVHINNTNVQVTEVRNVKTGPGAGYVDIAVAQQGTDRVRATVTTTGTPSLNTFKGEVRVVGSSLRYQKL